MSDFKAKMQQNPKFSWSFTPDPTGGAYSAPPDPLAGFKGPTLNERGGEGNGGMEGMGGECCGVQKILKMDPGNVNVNLAICHYLCSFSI